MKVPKIRFKGFEGAWRKRKLGDSVLLNRYKQISAEELQKLNEYHWDIALLPSSKNYDRKCNFYESLSNLINNAEIITVWRARNANTKYYKWKFIASQNHIIESFNNNEVNTKFLYLFILQHDKEFYSAESTYPMFTKQDFNDINLYYPNKLEQEKIWFLFEQLNSQITKNQQKLEKLKNMKQSFLQKLFPKDWSALPELRFKGFEGAWEERKLGEIWSILTWSTPSTSIKNNYSENWMLRVTPTDIKNNTIKETAKKLSFDWQQVARIVPKYSILVTCIASIWKNTMLLAEWSFNQQINALVPNPERTNSYFLLSESEIRSNKMKNRASSWTMQIVNKSEFSNISTFIPLLPEQEKIWAFFEKLDTQITQQTQKIQKLQNLKQSLLEKMFI